jgi:hypothetical protein
MYKRILDGPERGGDSDACGVLWCGATDLLVSPVAYWNYCGNLFARRTGGISDLWVAMSDAKSWCFGMSIMPIWQEFREWLPPPL